MDSSETKNVVMASGSSNSFPVQVSQQMSDMPRRSLQYDEGQQNTAAKNFHTPKFGIGLHLNSLLHALPMVYGPSANVESVEEDCMIVQGKKSLCNTDSHSTNNAGNSPTSSKATERLLKPTEHRFTSCDSKEYSTTLSSPKKRKRSTGFSGEDGCKLCNCKKTKCLKLYCDCFAARYYRAQTCFCKGCFNGPEDEDTVLDTRQNIVSGDPVAFAPKILSHVGQSLANNIQDINKSTPSSARHKSGCNCKKSMCLKKYCQCYQSNVGCSDGCPCAGCKNVFGKKEANNLCSSESVSSKHTAITEATNDIPEISVDQKLETSLHSDLSIPHNMTPSATLFQYSDVGKHALQSRVSYGICSQSPEGDFALSASGEKPSNSAKSIDDDTMIEETCHPISDLQLYDYNSKSVEDFSPHRCGNSLSLHHNPRSGAVACLASQTTNAMTNDRSSQLCPQSGTFSSLNSSQLCSSPTTSVAPFAESKFPVFLDSDSKFYNILEDDDISELLKKHPVSFPEVKVRSPIEERVSPPHSHFPELRPSSSFTALRGGRKYILKAVPSFPPLAPCTDVKSTWSPSNML